MCQRPLKGAFSQLLQHTHFTLTTHLRLRVPMHKPQLIRFIPACSIPQLTRVMSRYSTCTSQALLKKLHWGCSRPCCFLASESLVPPTQLWRNCASQWFQEALV